MQNHAGLRNYKNYVSELELLQEKRPETLSAIARFDFGQISVITHEPTEYGLSITNPPTVLYTNQSDNYIIYIIISLSVIVFAIMVIVKVRDPRPCI
jgi:hypothetical protein